MRDRVTKPLGLKVRTLQASSWGLKQEENSWLVEEEVTPMPGLKDEQEAGLGRLDWGERAVGPKQEDRLRRPLGCPMSRPDAGAQGGIGYEIRGLPNTVL